MKKEDIKIGQRVCYMNWFKDDDYYSARLGAIGTITEIVANWFRVHYDDGTSQRYFEIDIPRSLDLAP